MKIRSLIAGIALGFTLIACITSSASGQEQRERLIRRLPVQKNEPLRLKQVSAGGQRNFSNKPFLANDDWLRSLVILVQNRTDKLIVFASIRLLFPRAANSEGLPAVSEMFFGNFAPSEAAVGIAPGEMVEIRFSEQQYTDLRKFLDATNFPRSIDRLELGIDNVIFADDTMWYGGGIARRDPKDPASWVRLDDSERRDEK